MFEWTDEMNIGDPLIDGQHRQIFALLSAFNDRMTPEDIARAVAFMARYATTHFRDEEAFMERVGYPLLDEQKHEHLLFMSKVAVFSEQDTHAITLHIGLATFLTRWLKHHILTEIVEFKRHLKNRALSSHA
jgi:hemerythrin-like metal-binding protein